MLRRRPRRARLRAQSLNRLIPNILTLMALCAGLSAIRFGLEDKFHEAVAAIFVAAVFDGLDGRIARLIGATSKFGAELDSLSDFVCFGVVPSIVLYLWCMDEAGRVGWAVVLLFAVCMALRLARFNTAIDDETRPPWSYNYFTGVPAPAGAALALLPLIASFELEQDYLRTPLLVGLWLVLIAALTVSRIPTFSLKKVRVPQVMVLPVLLAVGVATTALVTEPWLTLVVVALVYLASIPFSIRATMRLRRAMVRTVPITETPEPPAAI